MRMFFNRVLTVFSNTVAAQVNLAAVQNNIERHIIFLASDCLEGRRAGTEVLIKSKPSPSGINVGTKKKKHQLLFKNAIWLF